MLTNNTHLTKEQIKKTGSFYTPLCVVEKLMSKIDDETCSDTTKTFCDPTCGTGAIIIPIADKVVNNFHII